MHYCTFFLSIANNKDMEIFFIVISILIIVVMINILINVDVEYDFYKNLGTLKLKIFSITILNFQISLIAGYFNLFRHGKKVIQIKLDLNDENFKFIGDVGEYFTKKIYLLNLKYSLRLYGTNPFHVALASGNLLVLEGILRSIILSKSPFTKVEKNFDIGYVDNIFKIKLGVGVLITIFDFIWAFLRALMKRSVYGKKTKFRRKC